MGSTGVYYVTRPSSCVSSPESSSYSPTFTFDYSSALNFYKNLNTTTGLYTRFPGDTSIYLADDQALDYYALTRIFDYTGYSNAMLMASRLAAAIENPNATWGAFFRYYNPVFEVVGKYPDTTVVMEGYEAPLFSYEGYAIKVTEYSINANFNVNLYADQLAYRVLLYLHVGDYCSAESSFNTLSGMWDQHGFADQAFTDSTSSSYNQYQSMKLALYLIAWKALASEPATQGFAFQHESTVRAVTPIMSTLQSPGGAYNGGVWTGYDFTNGAIAYGKPISLVNGETTSLFVLASGNVTTIL